MSDLQCPYCEADNEVCHDDGQGYAEDETHEMQCSSCDKYFVFTTCISFDYTPEKADCLNDGKHDYQPTTTYPREYTRLSCSMCDDKIDMTPEQKAKFMEQFK